MTSSSQHVPAAAPHGGVVYVGPSLGRSLLGLLVGFATRSGRDEREG